MIQGVILVPGQRPEAEAVSGTVITYVRSTDGHSGGAIYQNTFRTSKWEKPPPAAE
jgi:hypothetical protein